MRNRLINETPIICPERAEIYSRVLLENEDKPAILRAAMALYATLSEMTIIINDDELIVGNQGNGLRATTLNPAVNTWVEDELDDFEKRDGSRFLISEDAKARVRKLIPLWKGRTVYDSAMSLLEKDTVDAMNALVFTCGYTLTKGCGHWLLGIENVLLNGFCAFRAEAEAALSSLDLTCADGVDKIPFYKAIITVCDAVRVFSGRYAALAREKAENASPERKKELLTIADICDRVPFEPARSFREAVQTVYFVQLITQIESDGTGISLGRLDNMLYPFYENDIKNGALTKAEAEELLDCLWLKIGSIIQIWNAEDSKAFGGHPISQAVTIGGQNEDGSDATNELSYMLLETTARVHMAQPSVCVRVNRRSPDELLMLSAEVIREGLGMPAMYNDEIAIPSLVSRGVDIADARRDYGVIGCVEMGIQGKLNAFANSGYFNLAKAFEITLNGGVDPITGLKAAPERSIGGSYEELESAFFENISLLVKHQVAVSNAIDTMHARMAPLPFVSAFTLDCLKNGKEVQSGGARYNYDGIQGVGFADCVDSLAAIKKLVFDEKRITLQRLLDAVHANFEGYDDVLIMLRRDAPKYGNNEPCTNSIAHALATSFAKSVECHKNTRGGFFVPGMYSNSANVPLGAVCGALPNGRRAFTPIAEACSPCHGAEKNGPTQAALSVASLDHMILTNGSQYNQKYHPTALSGAKGLRSLVDLFTGFFDAGGYHIQFNVVSAETLRAAQKEPDKYRDLVVRVAGYTAFFTDLNADIQNDIIDRTEMSFS